MMLIASSMTSTSHGQHVEEQEAERLQSTSRPQSQSDIDAARAAELILNKTNEFRIQSGLRPLDQDARLANAAQYFANYMAQHDQFGHRADGNTLAERAAAFDYDYCLVAENIAYQYSPGGFATANLATKFVDVWKNSPPHRQNMLDPDAAEIGVAAARSQNTGYWYAVQVFGRPKSAAIEFTIQNNSDKTIDYNINGHAFQLPPNYTRFHTRCRSGSIQFAFQPEREVEITSGSRFTIASGDGRLELQHQKQN
jgi:uncharacterized protein YkwD